ncbi:MAG TPA: lipid-A-disaccharide synthase [Blastocatellia bacterium]|nr:lipid-A-disaccharide synthase [Blastocatellia bacterium]
MTLGSSHDSETDHVQNPQSSVLSTPLSLKIMIVAGEASGDKHGATLARALQKLAPGFELEIFGSGGEKMRAAGVETLVDARDVAIIGILEIVGAFGKLYRAYRKLLDAARKRRPAVVVLIDWPDFNIRLARKLHREGFKIVYYISPQVWAWRGYRVRALRRYVDRMLVILPFEKEFYKNAGVEVEYVGHPLVETVRADASREAFASRNGLDATRPIIALLPGSRYKEVHYHLPAMIDAALRLRTFRLRIADCGLRIEESTHSESQDSAIRNPNPQSAIRNPQSKDPQSKGPQFVIPVATTIDREQVDAIVGRSDARDELDLAIVERDEYNALRHSEIAVVASGTATVEAAILGTPMVIVYRGSELNWRLIRPLIKLDTFGMVNLIAGRRIAPELMQQDVTGERIAREVGQILGDPSRLAQMKRDLAIVRERLESGNGPASERAATAVMKLIADA